MTREIMFRTWNPIGKEMNYIKKVNYFGGTGFYDQSLDNENNIWMQYTGLKDRNGKEIFEGDILECANHWGRASIEWHNAGFRGRYYDHNDKVCYAMIASAPSEGIEVIGSIYENPEALQGEDTKDE